MLIFDTAYVPISFKLINKIIFLFVELRETKLFTKNSEVIGAGQSFGPKFQGSIKNCQSKICNKKSSEKERARKKPFVSSVHKQMAQPSFVPRSLLKFSLVAILTIVYRKFASTNVRY